MAEIIVSSTTEEKAPIYVSPTSLKGKPEKLDGAAVITLVDGGATTVAATPEEIAAADPALGVLVGFVVSEDAPGTSHFSISGDADLSTGVAEITDTITYNYTDPQAANLGTSAGAAVPKA